jgi:hypothetical protein
MSGLEFRHEGAGTVSRVEEQRRAVMRGAAEWRRRLGHAHPLPQRADPARVGRGQLRPRSRHGAVEPRPVGAPAQQRVRRARDAGERTRSRAASDGPEGYSAAGLAGKDRCEQGCCAEAHTPAVSWSRSGWATRESCLKAAAT